MTNIPQKMYWTLQDPSVNEMLEEEERMEVDPTEMSEMNKIHKAHGLDRINSRVT